MGCRRDHAVAVDAEDQDALVPQVCLADLLADQKGESGAMGNSATV